MRTDELLKDEEGGKSMRRAHAVDALFLMLAVSPALFGAAQDRPMTTDNPPTYTATPFNDRGAAWDNDGCSAVPDRGWWGDFHHACVHHDGCYRQHWASKGTCDEKFLSDMRASCKAMFRFWDWRTGPCHAQAFASFIAVSTFGGQAYYG